MKTSVNMIRKMGDFDVIQRTKDGMFNATDLLNQWNESSGQQKQIIHFFENKATKEFIEALKEESKERNSVYLKLRGKYGGTMMNPYLFIDFAMWLNPKFKVKVIRFVYDQLIKQRHDAGDNYISLSASGQQLDNYNFSLVANAMNHIVFGKKGKNLRQNATQEQLKELNDLQMKLAWSIDMGYVKTFDSLMIELRRAWKFKQNKTPF